MTATTAAIYVRISQDRDGGGLGVDRQQADCEALAERLGWSVSGVFVDNDVSAYSGKPRPEYERLLAALESGAIRGVLAWHPDRLHRSPTELETYINLAERKRIATHTVQAGHWDLSTPSGRAVARTLGIWARYESEHKGERIKAARIQQAKAGGWHGGMRPYGYEPDGVTIRVSEAREIVNAIEQIIAGVSLRSIVRELNTRGIPTATGRGKWTSVVLRDNIMRPRTAGLSSHLGEIVGKAVWPPIVPEDTWRAACAVLSDPSRKTNHRGGTVRWLGSGIYVCGVCFEPTLRVGTNGGSGRRTYRCGNRNRENTGGHVTREANTLDSFVELAVVKRLSRADAAALFVSGADSPDRGALELEKAGINARLDELASLFGRARLTASQLEAGSEPLMQRSSEISTLLAASVGRGPLAELASVEDIAEAWFGTQDDRSDGFSLGERRAILSAVAVVTVLPAKRGPVFDPASVRIEFPV